MHKNNTHRFSESALSRLTPTDYGTLTRELSRLSQRYPFISVSAIGSSVLQRSIPVIRLGNGKAPSVLYVATHHGMEWICAAVLLLFIEEYCSLYEEGARVYGISLKTLFDSRLISIIPMLNPDGAELQINGLTGSELLFDRLLSMNGSRDFTKWQANARGVDLNHNYDAGFKEYKILEQKAGIQGGCSTRFSGEYPESEPEVSALCSYIRWETGIKGALTLHTQGEEIYCNAKGSMAIRCIPHARLLSKLTGYALSEPEEMAAYGGMTDWMVSKANIPCFTLECGKGKNPLPDSLLFPIYTRLREVLFSFPLFF